MTAIDRYFELEKQMNAIDEIWDERNSTDAGCEPEWDQYENIIYLMAELFARNTEVKAYVLEKYPEKFANYKKMLQAS